MNRYTLALPLLYALMAISGICCVIALGCARVAHDAHDLSRRLSGWARRSV